jgi:hypothetical protein
MQVVYETITAQASEGLSMNEEVPVAIPADMPGELLIMAALQQVNQQGANGKVHVAITSYVQNGQVHQGSWPIVSGSNITNVTGSLQVTSAAATATVVIFPL